MDIRRKITTYISMECPAALWSCYLLAGDLLFMFLLCECSVTKWCLTIWDSIYYSPPGSSVHGISQARIPEWVSLPSPEDLPNPGQESWPRDQTQVSCISGIFFTIWATREAQILIIKLMIYTSGLISYSYQLGIFLWWVECMKCVQCYYNY